MSKRLKKKLDKKLYRAIKELNEDVMSDCDIQTELKHEEIMETLARIRSHPSKVRDTLNDYQTYIVNR